MDVGKNVLQEGVTNKTGFKQRSQRYIVVVGTRGERFKRLVDWAETQDDNAPVAMPE